MILTSLIVISILSEGLIKIVEGFSDGAPLESCDDMKPMHGYTPHTPDKVPCPYEVKISTALKGRAVLVTIYSTTVVNFTGFMVMAKDSDNKIWGRFKLERHYQVIDCLECPKVSDQFIILRLSKIIIIKY